MNLKAYLKSRQEKIDRALDRHLPKENTKPATIHKAMRYSLFAGGKRLRPVLCLAAAEACGGIIDDALPLACAIECIHTYSLVHDDLPAWITTISAAAVHLPQGFRRRHCRSCRRRVTDYRL